MSKKAQFLRRTLEKSSRTHCSKTVCSIGYNCFWNVMFIIFIKKHNQIINNFSVYSIKNKVNADIFIFILLSETLNITIANDLHFILPADLFILYMRKSRIRITMLQSVLRIIVGMLLIIR